MSNSNQEKRGFFCMIASWQDGRLLWLTMSAVSLILLLTAHSFFQEYLYMPPCEQCVYIRFSFFCLFFAGIFASISPTNIYLKILGYVLGFFGAIKGVMFSLKLQAIHKAIHGDDLFGVQGCSVNPVFPFGLPLAKWFPSWFQPTGDCGYDAPVVESGISLSSFQEYMINMYVQSDGWYLIPKYHFLSMADACLIAFAVVVAVLSLMLVSWILKLLKGRK